MIEFQGRILVACQFSVFEILTRSDGGYELRHIVMVERTEGIGVGVDPAYRHMHCIDCGQDGVTAGHVGCEEPGRVSGELAQDVSPELGGP